MMNTTSAALARILFGLIISSFSLPTNSKAQQVVPAEMRCYPDTLYYGDTLTIEFHNVPHMEELIIRTPGRTDFWVASEPDPSIGLRPLMPSHEFKTKSRIHIITNTTRSYPFVYKAKKEEPIFSRTGLYTIYFGENLATDDPSFNVEKARVYYNNKRRNK